MSEPRMGAPVRVLAIRSWPWWRCCRPIGTSCRSDDDPAVETFEFSGTAATLDGQEIPAQVIDDQMLPFQQAPEAAQTASTSTSSCRRAATSRRRVVADLLGTEIAVTAIQAELAKRHHDHRPLQWDLAHARSRPRSAPRSTSCRPPSCSRPSTATPPSWRWTRRWPSSLPRTSCASSTTAPRRVPAACVRHILVAFRGRGEHVLANLRAAPTSPPGGPHPTEEAG